MADIYDNNSSAVEESDERHDERHDDQPPEPERVIAALQDPDRKPLGAILRYDPTSHITWLEIERKPDDVTRAALKGDGWRWSGYRKQWYNHRQCPSLPARALITTTDGGQCDYASERADRLNAAADRAQARSDAAYQRSNDLVSMIPLGQPILVGHHSERADRNRRAKSWAAMDKSVAEAKTAERLRHAARSSAEHQAYYTTDPDALQRRADRLSADARKMRRSIDRRTQQLAARGETPTDHDRAYTQRLEALEREIADLQQRIREAGGITADRLAAAGLVAEVGDLVLIHGFTGVVKRVNPKTYTVTMSHADNWTLKLDRTRLQAILQKRDGTVPAEAQEPPATELPSPPRPGYPSEPETAEPSEQ